METISLFDKQNISEKYELEELSHLFKDIKLSDDEDLFAGCEYINHFPSFNNLSLESLVAFKLNQDSGLNMECSISGLTSGNPTSILKHKVKNTETLKPPIVALNWSASESNQRSFKSIQINTNEAKVHPKQQNSRAKLRSNNNKTDGWITHQQTSSHSKALFAETERPEEEDQDEWSKDSDPSFDALSSSNKQTRYLFKPTSAQNRKKKWRTIFKRWGKEKDKIGYNMLKQICEKYSLDIDSFFCIDQSSVIDEVSQEFISQEHSKIIQKIVNKYKWMRKPIYLYLRFQKIYLKESTLSVRESKLLKRLLIQSKDDEDICKQVMYHFPGKNLTVIEQAKQEFMRSKRFSKYMKDNV